MKLCGHGILCPTFQVPGENTSIFQKPPLLGGGIIKVVFHQLPCLWNLFVGNAEEKITDKTPSLRDIEVRMHHFHKNNSSVWVYSGTSIYRSRIDCFPAFIVRHLWSRIKFHTNNVIYSRIHRSPNYRFTAFIVCKSRSRHSISRMDRLKKKLIEVFICITFSLDYKFGNTVMQSRDLQLLVSNIIVSCQ
jgi:hypothetical protein